MPRRLIVLLTAALVLVPAATARAAWFPAVAIDGPNGDVIDIGNVDLARDGAGAVSYLRNDGGARTCSSRGRRAARGVAPERLDYTSGPRPRSSWPRATATGSRSPGSPTATSTRPSAESGRPRAVRRPGADRRAGRALAWTSISGVNGAAYAVWEQAGDVRAARLQDTTWSGSPQPLDVDPALAAGTGALRPRVAVSAEGYAVVTWGDTLHDGFTRVLGAPHHRA